MGIDPKTGVWQSDFSSLFGQSGNNGMSRLGGQDTFGLGDVTNIAGNTGVSGGSPQWSTMQKMFGGKNEQGASIGGIASPLIGAASAAMQGYLGYKQLGLANEQLDFAKSSFSKNFEAQRSTTNTRLRDRATAREAAVGPGAYKPVQYI